MFVISFIKKPANILIFVATLFRVFLAQLVGIWFASNQGYDDNLLISYAKLKSHFRFPDHLSLVKDMSYPIFLNFVHFTGLSYSIVLSMIWIIAAILTVKMFRYITNNKLFLMFVYLFVLFTPAAFDSWIGTRLYRNSIIAPFVFITFTLMFIIVLKSVIRRKISAKDIMLSSIFLGFIFSFTYFIKEDRIWLLPCLGLAILASAAIAVYRYITKEDKPRNQLVKLLITLCLPILIFMVNTNIYKAINYHYFGVYEINTRTEGEAGKFVNNVYKIHSDNRTVSTWAPYDAIEKAFDSSKTLSGYPQLKNKIFHTPWFEGDIKKKPIHGDFLTWVLRTALVDSKVWQSESQVNDLFKQVNLELEDAFDNGTLQKEKKFQISASSGGRSLEEIFQLRDLTIQEYKCSIMLDGYEPGGWFGVYDDLESCETATILTNMNHLSFQSEANNAYKSNLLSCGNNMASVVFKIYSFINPVLVILSVLGVLLVCFKMLQKQYVKKDARKTIHIGIVLIMLILMGVSFMYSLGIAWFSEFIGTSALKFYSVGLVPLISLFELFGLYLFIDNIIIKSSNKKHIYLSKGRVGK